MCVCTSVCIRKIDDFPSSTWDSLIDYDWENSIYRNWVEGNRFFKVNVSIVIHKFILMQFHAKNEPVQTNNLQLHERRKWICGDRCAEVGG